MVVEKVGAGRIGAAAALRSIAHTANPQGAAPAAPPDEVSDLDRFLTVKGKMAASAATSAIMETEADKLRAERTQAHIDSMRARIEEIRLTRELETERVGSGGVAGGTSAELVQALLADSREQLGKLQERVEELRQQGERREQAILEREIGELKAELDSLRNTSQPRSLREMIQEAKENQEALASLAPATPPLLPAPVNGSEPPEQYEVMLKWRGMELAHDRELQATRLREESDRDVRMAQVKVEERKVAAEERRQEFLERMLPQALDTFGQVLDVMRSRQVPGMSPGTTAGAHGSFPQEQPTITGPIGIVKFPCGKCGRPVGAVQGQPYGVCGDCNLVWEVPTGPSAAETPSAGANGASSVNADNSYEDDRDE